jgi:hypothetical protein
MGRGQRELIRRSVELLVGADTSQLALVRWSHVDIDYDPAWEDDIVEVVGRLDEIGDIIDGVVTRDEILNLMQLLGVADPK